MTWKITAHGVIETLTKHNWQKADGPLQGLVCAGGNHTSDATCVGCGAAISASEIIDVFGEAGPGGGLMVSDMADGMIAGCFDDDEVASTSH